MRAHPIIDQLIGLRRAAGINRSQVAVRAGVNRAVVRRWEIGEHTPQLNNLMSWASALGCVVAVQPYQSAPRLGVEPVVALAELRRRRGLTQLAFAEQAGFTQSQVSQWECGRVSPSLHALSVWVAALDCDLVLAPALLAVAA